MGESYDRAGNLVGVEASISSFNAVSVEPDGRIADSLKASIVPDQATVPQLIEFVARLKERFGAFERLGVAIPGLVDRESRRVAFSAHIPEHSDVDLAGEIAAEAGVETLIENDANSAAYGEFKIGAGRGSDNLFYATLGTGVGGAFIFKGKLWHGNAGFAGEFGYVPINSDGMRLEEVASSANIVRRTRSRFNRDSTSSLNKLDERLIGISDIVRAAENDDDFAQLMLERTGHYVGTAIACVINLLNIEKIVLGGEIMQAKHLVLDAVIHRARELSFGPSFEQTEIVEGELGENAAAIGVALLAADSSLANR